MRNGKRSRPRDKNPYLSSTNTVFMIVILGIPYQITSFRQNVPADSERFLSVSYEYEQQLADLSLPYISTRHHRLPAI